MKEPIITINHIDIYKVKDFGETLFMLKKGFCTIGMYYTLKEAKTQAKKN